MREFRSSAWACLVVSLILLSEVAAQTTVPAGGRLFLDRSSESALYASGVQRGPLLREIMRQAVLAEAREHFRLSIGDAWLGDPRPADSPDDVFDLVMSPGKANLIEILRGVAPTQQAVAQFALPPAPDKQSLSYVRFLTEMDALARGDLTAKPAELAGVSTPPAVAPPEVDPRVLDEAVAQLEPLINLMAFPTQFAAARKLHALIKQHGEQPVLVGLLVRAYANLGLLTEPYYTPAHLTFKARALVYAHRWTTREPQSPRASAHRAYAWSIIGIPRAALDDLAAIERREADSLGGAQDVPAWTSVIDAFCRFQLTSLAATPADDPHHQLALLLRHIASTRTGETPRIVATAIEAYNGASEAYVILDDFVRAIDDSYHFEHDDVDWEPTRSELYAAQQTVLGERLYTRIGAMTDLPPSVAAVLAGFDPAKTPPGSDEEFALRGRLISALLQTPAGDDPLSWPLLGRLVQEVSFRQAMESQAADDDAHGDLPKAMLPLVAEHRFRPYFQVRDWLAPNRDELLTRLAAGVDREALDNNTWTLLKVFSPPDLAYRSRLAEKLYGEFMSAGTHRDRVVGDLIWEFGARYHDPEDTKLKRLLEVDPYNPNGVYLALRYVPDQYAERLDAWKILSGDFPQIDALLVKQAAASATPVEQEAKLEAAFAKNPDPALVVRLAQLQLARNDLDAWERTMRDFIARSPQTDEVMKACCGAASTLVGRRQFERAVPFVEAAVERHHFPGHRAGVAVFEGLQRWESAENAVKVWSEGDFDARCEWYFFCKRTGQGDRDAAYDSAAAFIRNTERSGLPADAHALFAILEHEPGRALPNLRDYFRRVSDPLWGLHAAMLYDELGQHAERDAMLKDVREKGPKYRVGYTRDGRVRTGLLELGKLFEADLAAGGKAAFDPAVVEKLRAEHVADRGDFDCLLGVYYDRHGRADAAAQSWLRCMASTKIVSFSRTLAGSHLWDRAVAPAEYRDALQGRAPAGKQE